MGHRRGWRVAYGLLLMRVAGIGSNVSHPACRICRIDDLDGGLAVFVDWDGAFNF